MRLLIGGLRALCAALILATTAGGAAAADASRILTVRVYNAADLAPVDVVTAAEATAAPVLRATGIGVDFRFCRMPAPATARIDPCEQPLASGEVVVRIIDAPSGSTFSDRAYGVAYVIHPLNQGWLATVFADRISEGASRVRLERHQLLGLVLAHEVGHLLLGDGHADTGLMSAHWHDMDLKRAAVAAATPEWRFTPDQASVLQERLNER